jgi:hypothetical protein
VYWSAWEFVWSFAGATERGVSGVFEVELELELELG